MKTKASKNANKNYWGLMYMEIRPSSRISSIAMCTVIKLVDVFDTNKTSEQKYKVAQKKTRKIGKFILPIHINEDLFFEFKANKKTGVPILTVAPDTWKDEYAYIIECNQKLFKKAYIPAINILEKFEVVKDLFN